MSWHEYKQLLGTLWNLYTLNYIYGTSMHDDRNSGTYRPFDYFSGGLTALATFFTLWAGMNWESDILANALPVFWPSIGTVLSIMIGSLSGLYVGTRAMMSAYSSANNQESYWDPVGIKERQGFIDNYNHLTYNVIRGFETVMTTIYVIFGIALAGVPYYLALELQKYLDANASSAAKVKEIGYKLLNNGLVLAIGSWAAAYTLTVDDVLSYYDRIFQDHSGEVPANAILYDMIMHALKTLAIVFQALAEVGAAWGYVYYQLVPPAN